MNSAALAAATAYLATPKAGAGAEAGLGKETGFGQMVADAMQGAVDTGKATEAKIADVTRGDGDMVEVVTAIAETELALETMVTVRDRVINAYQEIMNMPI